MQALFVLIAIGTIALASVDPNGVGAHDPGLSRPISLVILAVVSLFAARSLGGRSGVKIPTPARLDELVGRAEQAAVQRAELSAGEDTTSP